MKKVLTVIMLSCAFWTQVFADEGGAPGYSAGLYQSLKGAGVTFSRMSVRNGMEDFSFTADFAEILLGENDIPGYKVEWDMLYPVKGGQSADGFDWIFYIGPGISGGYVRDGERGLGIMASLCANEGVLLRFYRKSVTIKFEFTQEFGFHMNGFEDLGGINLGLYRNGLGRCLYPQVKIMWDFR